MPPMAPAPVAMTPSVAAAAARGSPGTPGAA